MDYILHFEEIEVHSLLTHLQAQCIELLCSIQLQLQHLVLVECGENMIARLQS